MVSCMRCGKKQGRWRCKVCGKVVCDDCVKVTKEGVFCIDHVPTSGGKAKPKVVGSSAVKGYFLTLLILTIGMGFLILIAQKFIPTTDVPAIAKPFVDALKQGGYVLVGGMAAITFFLGIGYVATRRKVE